MKLRANAILLLLVGAVLASGSLQYQWLERMRQLEEAHLRAGATAAAEAFSAEADRRITEDVLSIQRGCQNGRPSQPRSVRAILRFRPQGEVLQWDSKTKTWSTAATIPPGLSHTALAMIGPFVYDPPAMVFGCGVADETVDYWLAVFDFDGLSTSVLRPLGARYFGGADAEGFRARVTVASDPPRAIWDSGWSGGAPDVKLGFLRAFPTHFMTASASPVFMKITEPFSRGGQNFLFGNSLLELSVQHRLGSVGIAALRHQWQNFAFGLTAILVLSAGVLLTYATARKQQELARFHLALTAAISHELKTPLALVCSASQNLAEGVVHEMDEARDYGKLILDAGRRLADTVSKVLALAVLERQETTSARELVAVRELLADVIGNREIPVRNGDGVRVPGDGMMLRAAFENLINNAVKHGEGRNVSAEIRREGHHAAIFIRDQGPGLPIQDRPHLFEPFYRGSRAVANQSPGNGLGLFLVKRIVESHGGSVIARARKPEGAEFEIRLPLPQEGRE